MRWYRDLYLGDSMKGKRKYYQYVIQYTKKITGTYCILPAGNPEDLLDICHSELLRMEKMYARDQLVLGLAGSRREAFELAGAIVLDVVNQTGGTDIRAYFNIE